MITDLCSIFEEQGKFIRLVEIKFFDLNSVYISPEQAYGIAVYDNEEQLINNWERSADELAVKVQSRLTGELSSLKWDMYLVLFVKQNGISTVTRKKIENDRHFFKKILLTEEDYPFSFKLPLLLDIKPHEEFVVFNDYHFLQELKGFLSTHTIESIGLDFFEGKSEKEYLHKRFVLPYEEESGKN